MKTRTFVSGDFSLYALDQVTDGHTRGNGMEIDNDVGCETLTGERRVLLPILNSACTLLSVTRRKLVADLWDAHAAHANFTELVSLAVQRQHYLIDYPSLAVAQKGGCVAFRKTLRRTVQLKARMK